MTKIKLIYFGALSVNIVNVKIFFLPACYMYYYFFMDCDETNFVNITTTLS